MNAASIIIKVYKTSVEIPKAILRGVLSFILQLAG